MMQQLNSLFLLIALLSTTIKGFAQFDKPNGGDKKGTNIGVIKAPVKEIEKPKTLGFDNIDGFKTANQKLQKKYKKQQAERDLKNKGIITPEMMAKQAYKKNFEGKFGNFPKVDMDLGSFHTKSEFVYIKSYDFGKFDGDKVQIAINGKVHTYNLLLTHKIKTVKIPLDVGINKIEVTALNEGDFSPNTGYFAFIDDKNEVIKKDQWMLAKGAKVIAIVVRDEK